MTYLYYALPFIVCVRVAVCAWAGAHNAPKCEPCLVSKPTEQVFYATLGQLLRVEKLGTREGLSKENLQRYWTWKVSPG